MNTQRILALLLLLALAAVFFLGGMVLRGHPSIPPPPSAALGDHRGLMGTGMALRQQGVKVLGESAWHTRQQALERLGQAVAQARQEVRQQLAAEPLDRAALTAALTDLRQRMAALQETTHQVLLEVAERLPAAERAELLAPMGHSGRGLRGRGNGP